MESGTALHHTTRRGDFLVQQPVEKVGAWSNFRREDMFHRSTMAENLDLTPFFHFFNRLLERAAERNRP